MYSLLQSLQGKLVADYLAFSGWMISSCQPCDMYYLHYIYWFIWSFLFALQHYPLIHFGSAVFLQSHLFAVFIFQIRVQFIFIIIPALRQIICPFDSYVAGATALLFLAATPVNEPPKPLETYLHAACDEILDIREWFDGRRTCLERVHDISEIAVAIQDLYTYSLHKCHRYKINELKSL